MTNWEKILGGYATGTLTGEERAALMQAALRDQDLFDVLMDEEALRETLADPGTRAALLRALEPGSVKQAWWRNPWPWTGLGAVAAAVTLFIILRPVEAPRPVQMAQNRPVAAAPEPVPTVIETPKQLQLSNQDVITKSTAQQIRQDAERQSAETFTSEKAVVTAQAPAITTPSAAPPPVPAPQPTFQSVPAPAPRKEESARVEITAHAPRAMVAQRKAVASELAVKPLAVTLSYQTEDGVWRALDLQSAVPASRPLRLKVTSARSGVLALQPPLAASRSLVAGVPSEISLPGQPAGTLRLRLALVEPAPEAAGVISNELREGKTSAMADAAAPAAAPSLTREIRLRIE